MADSVHKAICEAVVTLVSTFNDTSLTFEAERTYQATFDVNDAPTDEVAVNVAPRSLAVAQLTRKALQNSYGVDIGIEMKLAKVTDETVDPLQEFAEKLVKFVGFAPNLTSPPATLVEVLNDPIYDGELLASNLVFRSVIQLTYNAKEVKPVEES